MWAKVKPSKKDGATKEYCWQERWHCWLKRIIKSHQSRSKNFIRPGYKSIVNSRCTHSLYRRSRRQFKLFSLPQYTPIWFIILKQAAVVVVVVVVYKVSSVDVTANVWISSSLHTQKKKKGPSANDANIK